MAGGQDRYDPEDYLQRFAAGGIGDGEDDDKLDPENRSARGIDEDAWPSAVRDPEDGLPRGRFTMPDGVAPPTDAAGDAAAPRAPTDDSHPPLRNMAAFGDDSDEPIAPEPPPGPGVSDDDPLTLGDDGDARGHDDGPAHADETPEMAEQTPPAAPAKGRGGIASRLAAGARSVGDQVKQGVDAARERADASASARAGANEEQNPDAAANSAARKPARLRSFKARAAVLLFVGGPLLGAYLYMSNANEQMTKALQEEQVALSRSDSAPESTAASDAGGSADRGNGESYSPELPDTGIGTRSLAGGSGDANTVNASSSASQDGGATGGPDGGDSSGSAAGSEPNPASSTAGTSNGSESARLQTLIERLRETNNNVRQVSERIDALSEQLNSVSELGGRLDSLASSVETLRENQQRLQQRMGGGTGEASAGTDGQRPRLDLIGVGKDPNCRKCPAYAMINQGGRRLTLLAGDSFRNYTVEVQRDRMVLTSDDAQYTYFPGS